MGLDERDYMWHRNRRTLDRLLQDVDPPFTPPAEGPSLLVMIGWWVGAAFLVYKAYGWWTERDPGTPRNPSSYQQPQYPPQGAAPPAPAPREPAVQPAPSMADAPAPSARVIEASQPRTGGTIYLCRDYSGGSFWASDHCNRHRALVDRMVSVPEGMPFAQQVQVAEQRRQALNTATTVERTFSQAPAPAPNRSLCGSLDARVSELDALARQPQSGSTQDWIRSQRQEARDEQFRLHC